MDRPPLTRDAIVAAGRRLAEADGVAALSMRRVAAALDRSPMALYRHVADKRELLVLILDDVAAGIEVAVPPGSPAQQLAGLFLALHDYLGRFPWVVDVLRQGELFAPRALRFAEAALEALAAGGRDGEDGLRAYLTLWHYTIGHLASAHPTDPEVRAGRAEIAHRAPLEELPRIRALLPLMAGFDAAGTYPGGLRAVICGILAAE